MTEELLNIGEVAARTGTATSALRYYEQLGLVQPLRRESGRRRYAPFAIQLVGAVILLQEVGFTLDEVRRLLDSPSSAAVWRDLAQRKLGDLDRQIGKAQAARNAIEHALACPNEGVRECPNFWAVVSAVMEGKSLEEALPH
jgi:DNA-binding transcriptional MerR regulator